MYQRKYHANFIEEDHSLSHICGICGKAYLGFNKICPDCFKKEEAREEVKRIARIKRTNKLQENR